MRGMEGRSPVEAAVDDGELIAQIDLDLERFLAGRPLPGNLREAARYALLAPGKRTRPLLVLRSCEALGGNTGGALPAAGAVEMVHAFSLVHDDLPAMDDDDLRRGRPTLHRHTSEAMAVLAGDALLGLAVECVTTRLAPPALACAVARELIQGTNDMIAGQVYDTLPEAGGPADPLERLRTIHRHKTGALIRAACRMGGLCGGADGRALDGLTRYAEAIGLMFQVVDDLLDVTQTTEHLGKTAGKDAGQHKLTYPAVLGIDGTRREIERLRGEALAALEGIGAGRGPLQRLCEYLAVRTR
jgi:geranylgeranyl diphosphate synthase type II